LQILNCCIRPVDSRVFATGDHDCVELGWLDFAPARGRFFELRVINKVAGISSLYRRLDLLNFVLLELPVEKIERFFIHARYFRSARLA